MDKEAIAHDFGKTQRLRRTTDADVGWDDNFFDLMEPPAHWMRTRPAVVCLYRMIPWGPCLLSMFLTWTKKNVYYTWTDITESRVLEFLESVWRCVINTMACATKPVIVSTALL